MTDQELLATAADFAIAILLGALIGIEREKRKSEEDDTGHVAGLRTFTLLALLGAVAGWLERETSAPWILAAAILIVGALVIVGYFINAKPGPDDKGLTTEIAAMVVFLLGAIVMLGDQALAIGVGVITAAVLAYKQPLHGFVEKLGWDDVYAGVRMLIATFIALPLLQTRPHPRRSHFHSRKKRAKSRKRRRSEIRRPVRGGSPRDQVRAGAFSAERPLCGRRARRPDRCRCHHAVDVGVRPKRRRTCGGHRHRDRGAFEYPGEMRHDLRAGWPCARQAACGRDSRDPHRRARRGFLLPALHVVLAGH